MYYEDISQMMNQDATEESSRPRTLKYISVQHLIAIVPFY